MTLLKYKVIVRIRTRDPSACKEEHITLQKACFASKYSILKLLMPFYNNKRKPNDRVVCEAIPHKLDPQPYHTRPILVYFLYHAS